MSNGFLDPDSRAPPDWPARSATVSDVTKGMSGEPLRRKVKVTNPQGLHMRPITKFVELAGRYQSCVYVYKEESQRINGKSAISLLGLAAEQGTELFVEVCGPDQEAALEALANLLATWSTEENEEPPAPSKTDN
jgi:phosphocarrier protein HPr